MKIYIIVLLIEKVIFRHLSVYRPVSTHTIAISIKRGYEFGAEKGQPYAREKREGRGVIIKFIFIHKQKNETQTQKSKEIMSLMIQSLCCAPGT